MSANTAKPGCGSQRAESLKNEGNALHQKGKYRAACLKYSAAIKEDPKNAVYYANRAASSLALKEYLDAASDAKKATDLDPTYAKAWGRLGSAKAGLASWNSSIAAWKEALGCLPAEDANLTEIDKRMKIQFFEGLRKAELGLEEAKRPRGKVFKVEEMALPWQRAEAIANRYRAEGKLSSAIALAYANNSFMLGVETMNNLKKETALDGRHRWFGKPTALVDLTNGLMRDLRTFRIDHPSWFARYNTQVIFECEVYNGWNDGGANVVKEQAPKRLQREGWPSTRRALSMTIRGWMMCGFFATIENKTGPAVEFHSRVVDVLDWGSLIWHDVPKDDRGTIFDGTFIRGAKRFLINAVHEALESGTECSYTRENLAEMCRDMIAETDIHPFLPNAQIDEGFYLSFWEYPKSDAFGCLGWYHMHLGLEAEDAESASLEFDQASKHYIQAASPLPDDEEMKIRYLSAAIEALWYNNQSPRVYMPLVLTMIDCQPKMLEIWEHSPYSEQRDQSLDLAVGFARLLTKTLEGGKYSKDHIIKPAEIKKLDKFPAPDVIYL